MGPGLTAARIACKSVGYRLGETRTRVGPELFDPTVALQLECFDDARALLAALLVGKTKQARFAVGVTEQIIDGLDEDADDCLRRTPGGGSDRAPKLVTVEQRDARMHLTVLVAHPNRLCIDGEEVDRVEEYSCLLGGHARRIVGESGR